MLKSIESFIKEEDGIGTVEMVLILAVLIGLVVIFKDKLTALVNTLLKKINDKANKL